jgi:hypothetical protein
MHLHDTWPSKVTCDVMCHSACHFESQRKNFLSCLGFVQSMWVGCMSYLRIPRWMIVVTDLAFVHCLTIIIGTLAVYSTKHTIARIMNWTELLCFFSALSVMCMGIFPGLQFVICTVQ